MNHFIPRTALESSAFANALTQTDNIYGVVVKDKSIEKIWRGEENLDLV